MAAVQDPYSPCPCGSGQKFKWCCQKVEHFAEKAQRLFDTGQVEAAISAADEGLKRFPGNPWLTIRKAIYLLRKKKPEQARPILEQLLIQQPDHLNSHLLLVQTVLIQEGPLAGAAQVQRALAALPPNRRSALGSLILTLASYLHDLGHVPAALKHAELCVELMGGSDEAPPEVLSTLEMMQGQGRTSPWLRHDYVLAPPPEGLSGSARDRFEQALGWAREGLWASAGSAFEPLAADGILEADRNQGLCHLWMGEDAAAVRALRRYNAGAGETTDAVDLEALCQLITTPTDLVALVHWIWTLRDRDRLLQALRQSDRAQEEGSEPLDPEQPEGVQVETFGILDRPRPAGEVPTDPRQLPQVVGRVLVGTEIVILEGADDGRLDRLSNWLCDVAGPAIPPAHPRSKTITKMSRSGLALQPELWVPKDWPPDRYQELAWRELAWRCGEIWPQTRLPMLGGRTPLQAAEAGDARVALRAAVCMFEWDGALSSHPVDFAALRARLRIPDEPEFDPETVDVERIHLARLHRGPIDRLDDDRLVALYERARRYMLPIALERAALALIARPEVARRAVPGIVRIYNDLANLELARRNAGQAFAWLERGRQADPNARTSNAIQWEFATLRIKSETEPPEKWVPDLAVLLDRYRDDQTANAVIFSNLLQMGLVQLAPHPEKRGEVLLDTRPLSALLSEYGPRITTAAGSLGVSASKGGIWTPGSAPSGGTTSGGIWTPDSAAAPSGEKKIILPG